MMKLYGQAEYAWHLIESMISKLTGLTEAQKEILRQKCREVVFHKYSSVRDLEVTG